MARKSKADLRLERQQLLKEYERRRSTIQKAEARVRKAGGKLTEISTPKLTAKQLEKARVGIRQLRTAVEELRDINIRVIRKRAVYPAGTGKTITGTELFHRHASEGAKKAAETRQGIPPELRRLREAVTRTQEPRMKEILKERLEEEKRRFINNKKAEEKQRKFDEEQKERFAQRYIEAVNDNDTQMIEHIKRGYEVTFHENIEDNPIVKDTLFPEAIPEIISPSFTEEPEPIYEETKPTYEEPEESEYEYEEPEDYDTGTDYEYGGDDYRVGEQYAPEDLPGYLSYLDTITELIKNGFYNTRGGLRRGKGRQGWSPYNFDEDRNTLLEMWKDVIDEYSNTPEDRKSLIEHIMANAGRLSELMTAIEYDSNQATYNVHYAEVYNILHFDAPTVEDLMDYGDIEEL